MSVADDVTAAFETVRQAYDRYLSYPADRPRLPDYEGLAGYVPRLVAGEIDTEALAKDLRESEERAAKITEWYTSDEGLGRGTNYALWEIEDKAHSDRTLTEIHDEIWASEEWQQKHNPPAPPVPPPSPQPDLPCFFGASTICHLQIDGGSGHDGFIEGEYQQQWLAEDRYRAHCKAYRAAGCNLDRFLPYGVWGGTRKRSEVLSPFRFLRDQDCWDLSKWNENYFLVVKRMLAIAAEEGYEALVFELFDNCQGHSNNQFSPYSNNVNNVGSIYDDRARAINAAWVQRAVAEFSLPKVSFGQGNELEPAGVGLWTHLLPLLKGKPLYLLGCCTGANNHPAQIGAQDAQMTEARAVLGGQANWLARTIHQATGSECLPFNHALNVWAGRYRLYFSNDGKDCSVDGAIQMIRAFRMKVPITRLTFAFEWMSDPAGDVVGGCKRIVAALKEQA